MEFMIVREVVNRLSLTEEEKDTLAEDIVLSLSEGAPTTAQEATTVVAWA